MSLDGSKNDSRMILPKINWERSAKEKSSLIQKEQYSESFNNMRLKKPHYLNPIKPIIKRDPTNYQLIKILKINKEEIKNNHSDLKINIDKKNYSQMNHKKSQNELVNDKKVNIIEYEFPLLRRQLLKSKSNTKIASNQLKINDIHRINHINKKYGNKSAIISNKLIANKIRNVKLSNREKNGRHGYMVRNKHYLSDYSPSSAYVSFSNETRKNNNIPNTNINNSINIFELKLNTPLPKLKQDENQNIFISKLNIKSTSYIKRDKRFSHNIYVKKWDAPKSFSFEKITGREKEIKNPIKLQLLERMFEYSPNYDSILSNNSKSYVKFNNDIKNDFKQYKINTTRKYIFNRLNIMNSPSNNYNIINILNEQKLKEQQKIEKKKLDKILEDFVLYHKNMNNDI